MPRVTRWFGANTFQGVFARLSSELPRCTPAPDVLFPRRASTSLCWWFRGWSGFWCRFCTPIFIVSETTLVTSRTLSQCFPLLPPLSIPFGPLVIRNHCFKILSCLAWKFRNLSFWIMLLFTLVIQFQYGFELIRLTYPQFAQDFTRIITLIMNFVPFWIEFLSCLIVKYRSDTTGFTVLSSFVIWVSELCFSSPLSYNSNTVLSWSDSRILNLHKSPLEHCPLVFHCQQYPGVHCPRYFVSWFLTTAFVS